MSEEKFSDNEASSPPIEENEEALLKSEPRSATSKKKFVMTPARAETLRKGREKRAQLLQEKKKEQEESKIQLKNKKEEIKKRVEEEMNKTEPTPQPEPVAPIPEKPALKRTYRKKTLAPEPTLEPVKPAKRTYRKKPPPSDSESDDAVTDVAPSRKRVPDERFLVFV